MAVFLLQAMLRSGVELLTLLGGLVIIGFLLGQMEGLANQNLWNTFGKKGILTSALIGTPVHELSHFFMCFVFHHKVEQVKLLQFRSNDGTLGFVRHRYNPHSLYQKMGNFFIGIAPILGGIVTVFLLMAWLLPASFGTCYRLIQEFKQSGIGGVHTQSLLRFGLQILGSIFNWQTIGSARFWLFLILSIGISSHVSLSKEDINGALSGIASLFVLLFIVNSGLALFQVNVHFLEPIFLMGNLYLLATGSLIMVFSGIHLGVTALLRLLFGARVRRLGVILRDPFDLD